MTPSGLVVSNRYDLSPVASSTKDEFLIAYGIIAVNPTKNKHKGYNKIMDEKRADLLLMLLYAPGISGKVAEPLAGVTRLNKLLFLLENEGGVEKNFDFKPYKMGPYSSKINPVIEFLTTFPDPKKPVVIMKEGYVKSGTNLEQTQYMDDIASTDDRAEELDKYNSSTFSLSDSGVKLAQAIWNSAPDNLRSTVETIKTKYSSLTLNQLLKYVYSNYPDMITRSEIRDKILP